MSTYTPVSNVEPQLKLALDTRDIEGLLAQGVKAGSVNWAAVKKVYEKGGNSQRGDGSNRTIAAIATNPAVVAQFPNGPSIYGTPGFLDANVKSALDGSGRCRGMSEESRRQVALKSIQAIVYGEVLEELEAAKMKVQKGNTDDAKGAPHNMDEAWAYYAGAADATGDRPYSLSSTARKRERDFNIVGKLDSGVLSALAKALAASRAGDAQRLAKSADETRGHINTIFYLASIRYAGRLVGDTDLKVKEVHLAEGWAFFQTIRAAVGSADAKAAQVVEEVYSRAPAQPVTQKDAEAVYKALNGPAVRTSLGIPTGFVVQRPG